EKEDPGGKGHEGEGVGTQSQPEDGLLAPAVEAVEKPGQGKGGKGHSAGQGSTALGETNVEGSHGGNADEKALGKYLGKHGPVHHGSIGVPGLLVHKTGPGGLHSQGNGGKTVGKQVDKEQVYRLEGNGQSGQGGVDDSQNGGHVA